MSGCAPLVVRSAVPEDLEALSALAYRSKKSNGYDEAAIARMTEALEMTTGRLAQHRFWVAEENGRIIGCVALAPIDNITAAVRTFFIEPEHKGRGIGKQLWFALLTIAQSQGLTRLSARPDPASLPFYESIGFKTEAFAPSPHVPCVNVPRMWREI